MVFPFSFLEDEDRNLDDFSAVLKQAPCRHDKDFARTSGVQTSFQISTEEARPQARQALASVVQTFDSAVCRG